MHALRILLGFLIMSYAYGKTHSQELLPPFSFMFNIYALVSFLLSCFAGICSGLTVGYMSISKGQMQIWEHSQNQEEKRVSKAILSVLTNHHLLLSTLLLSNALALQALPIFLDKIVPSYLAVIISTAAVVVFGEVIPQAYCTGPNKVKIGYLFSGFVRFLEWILYPFVGPITYILDNWLGHHEQKLTLTKQNLKALLNLHNKKQYGYRPQQVQILQNTLDLRTDNVKDHMVPIEKVFMLEQNQIIDLALIDQIEKSNFSKIPVYRKVITDIVGYIKVKNLTSVAIKDKKKIIDANIINYRILRISQQDNLLQAIDKFKSQQSNIAVIEDGSICSGILTSKQIFQRIVLKEFKDDDVRVAFNFDTINKAKLTEAKQQD